MEISQLKTFLDRLKFALQDKESKNAIAIRNELGLTISFRHIPLNEYGLNPSIQQELASFQGNRVFECAAKFIIRDILCGSTHAHQEGTDQRNIDEGLSYQLIRLFATDADYTSLVNSPEAKALRDEYMVDEQIKDGYTFAKAASKIIKSLLDETRIQKKVIEIFNNSEDVEKFVLNFRKIGEEKYPSLDNGDHEKIYSILKNISGIDCKIDHQGIDKLLNGKRFFEWLYLLPGIAEKAKETVGNRFTFLQMISMQSNTQEIQNFL